MPGLCHPDVDRREADGRGTVTAVTVLHTGEPTGVRLVALVEGVTVIARCPTDRGNR